MIRKSKTFILQTANDYDMEFDEVIEVANNSENYTEFYDKLESIINKRSVTK